MLRTQLTTWRQSPGWLSGASRLARKTRKPSEGQPGNRGRRAGLKRLLHAALLLIVAFAFTACASRRSGGNSQVFPGEAPSSSGANKGAATATAQPAPNPDGSATNPGGTIVTPAAPKLGRVTLVNPSARYVIVTFSVGQLPVREARLNVYRDGLKVAELKVTDFVRDINAAADIMAGECRVGDEVRVP